MVTDLHHIKVLPVNRVTAILTISVGYVTPATSQNCWMLNVQFASFWVLPSYFSSFCNFILEPVNVPGPIAAGGAGGASGGCVCYAAGYAACRHFTTSSMRSFAVYGTVSEICVTWLYRS